MLSKIKMSVISLDSSNFEKEVLNYEGTVIVDFFATWCNPCRMQSPIIDEIAKEKEGIIKVCKLDVDNAPEWAEKYDVMSIPTFIVFKNGEPEKITVGMQPEENLKEMLEM